MLRAIAPGAAPACGQRPAPSQRTVWCWGTKCNTNQLGWAGANQGSEVLGSGVGGTPVLCQLRGSVQGQATHGARNMPDLAGSYLAATVVLPRWQVVKTPDCCCPHAGHYRSGARWENEPTCCVQCSVNAATRACLCGSPMLQHSHPAHLAWESIWILSAWCKPFLRSSKTDLRFCPCIFTLQQPVGYRSCPCAHTASYTAQP